MAGRLAVITGATSGIGFGTARAFITEGVTTLHARWPWRRALRPR